MRPTRNLCSDKTSQQDPAPVQRLALALIALAALAALAAALVGAGRRLLAPAGPRHGAGGTLTVAKERPVQKIAFVLLSALVLYVSFGGG